jgi:hypothetical protein
MTTDRRTLELLGQDLISDWGDLHNEIRTLGYNISELHKAAVKLEEMIDTHVTALLKTVGDQLDEDLVSKQS